MSVYLLFYDTNSGAREEWNIFYTSVEAFPTAEARSLRHDWLCKKYPQLGFHTIDLEYETHASVQRPVDLLENDFD